MDADADRWGGSVANRSAKEAQARPSKASRQVAIAAIAAGGDASDCAMQRTEMAYLGELAAGSRAVQVSQLVWQSEGRLWGSGGGRGIIDEVLLKERRQ